MTKSTYDWTDLRCDYFEKSVRDLIDPVASQHGYVRVLSGDEFSIQYRDSTGDLTFFVDYLPETAPRYELRCLVGIFGSDRRQVVPLWYLEKLGKLSVEVPAEFHDIGSLERSVSRYISILFSSPSGVMYRKPEEVAGWIRHFEGYSPN